MRLDKITIRLISQSDKISQHQSYDGCRLVPSRRAPYTLPSAPQSPGTQADEEDGLRLDTVSIRPKRPSLLSHSMRRPLGKSPALVMSQYSMSSHTHLRHLEIQSHLRWNPEIN